MMKSIRLLLLLSLCICICLSCKSRSGDKLSAEGEFCGTFTPVVVGMKNSNEDIPTTQDMTALTALLDTWTIAHITLNHSVEKLPMLHQKRK